MYNLDFFLNQIDTTSIHSKLHLIIFVSLTLEAIDVFQFCFGYEIIIQKFDSKPPSNFHYLIFGIAMICSQLVGSILWTQLSYIRGRRYTMLTAQIISAICSFISIFAQQIYFFVTLRCIVLFCLPGIIIPGYLLYGEFLPDRLRVSSLVFTEQAFSIGCLYSFLFSRFAPE